MGGSTKVKLTHAGIKEPQAFDIEHAEKILKMKKNGGWKLADSKFIQDENGDIKRNTAKRNSQAE